MIPETSEKATGYPSIISQIEVNFHSKKWKILLNSLSISIQMLSSYIFSESPVTTNSMSY